jgi:integrase
MAPLGRDRSLVESPGSSSRQIRSKRDPPLALYGKPQTWGSAGALGTIRLGPGRLDETERSHEAETHRDVPLGKDAIKLLKAINREGDFLFPSSRIKGQPLENLRNQWAEVCKSAKLTGFRIHDLRHTYASHLVSAGTPLAHVVKLLGHTQSQTTERYARLADSSLREATNHFGKIVEGSRRARAARWGL